MKYGIQLYSIRDITKNEMDRVLSEISKMGYSYAEFAGFFDYTAKEIRDMLDKYRLEVSGTHTGWTELTSENLNKTLAYHKEIGNKNIIIPGADLSNAEKLDSFIELVNEVQPKLEKEGIALHYHNHAREFIMTDYGKIIHSELEARTNIKFEIDTYWCYNAGRDPVETLYRLKDRVQVIHIKDGMSDGKGKPLGMGEAPVKAVYDTAKALGMLMVVESETLTPSGLDEAQICIDYLKSIED